MTTQTKPKPRGRTGPRKRTGHGPIYDTAVALGLSQMEMAARLKLGIATIRRLERTGGLPTNSASREILENLMQSATRKQPA